MIDIRSALVHAVTRFDRKESEKAEKKGSYHNPYALGQYLARIEDIMGDIERGATPSAAIEAGFSAGRLRKACLTACGLEGSTVDRAGSYKGMPVYRPITKESGK